ncbi:MAG: hypothetical protein NVS4B11_25690 [Ktedonobacteraceae bacterium]
MKAVAAALVLIAGAAVVLWYGNTLNSWVLGGLIGGLAALLLSIPISLMVFSYLSKRHDERLQVEEQEEIALARESYDYPHIPARVARRPREVEGYVVTDETPQVAWQEEASMPRVPRALPPPIQQRQGSASKDQGSKNSDRLPVPQNGTYVPVQRPQQARPGGKETTNLRATTKKINSAAFPGYEATSSLSHHRSEALRTARLEAAKQRQDDDVEVLPTNNPKRGLSVRPNQALAKHNEHTTSVMPQRPARQLPQQTANQPRSRRVINSSPSQQAERASLSTEGESAGTVRRPEPRTDYISNQLPQTAPLRRSSQTGQSARSSQEYEQSSNTESTSGNVNRPLVRRAPYMYEDDPLRQELAQHLDAPAVRRSSRFNGDDEGE